MRHCPVALAAFWLFAGSVIGQPDPVNDPFLDRLAGTWILRGTISGKDTTHDVVAEWVLAQEYLRIHEWSREKDGKGQARYEAIVLIGWDAKTAEYQCLWLDSTGGGGLSAQSGGAGRGAIVPSS